MSSNGPCIFFRIIIFKEKSTMLIKWSLISTIMLLSQTAEHCNSRHRECEAQNTDSQNMCRSRGGTGGPDPPPPMENYTNIGFLSNTGPDPLKITKLPIQHSLLGHHRPASEMTFKLRFAGGLLVAR